MKVIWSKNAQKSFEKIDKATQKKILKYTDEIEKLENPRSCGKRLVGNLNGFWRYRVADYRIICQIKDDQLIIIVVEIGHRRNIYT